MSFQQFKLTKSINQSRCIFDKYLYAPDNGDDLNDIVAGGYFNPSRFSNGEGWLGSIIEVQTDNDYALMKVSQSGASILIDSRLSESLPSNVFSVNSMADLPAPVGGVITITEVDAVYLWAPGVDLGANRIVTGVGTVFAGWNISQAPVTYSGTMPFITTVNSDFLINDMSLDTPNADMFHHTGSGFDRFSARQISIQNCLTAFTMSQSTYIIDTIVIFNCVRSLVVAGVNLIIGSLTKYFSISTGSVALDLGTSTHLEFEMTDVILIGSTFGLSGLADGGNMSPGVVGTVQGCNFLGVTTPLQNIDIADPSWSFFRNSGLANSSVRGILQFDGNSLVTSIAAANTPVRINAIWSDGQVEQRFEFGDKVNFDNTTNTLTPIDDDITLSSGSAFSHGMSNGDSVILLENGGLPNGLSEDVRYFVGDVTATTYRLYEEVGLSTLVTFSTNGTGPNYYRHKTGDSAAGWFIYTGLDTIAANVGGWVTIEKASGPDAPVRAVIMCTDLSYNVVEMANASTVSAKSGVPSSSQVANIMDVDSGVGFLIYVENISGTVDNIITDSRIIGSLA